MDNKENLNLEDRNGIAEFVRTSTDEELKNAIYDADSNYRDAKSVADSKLELLETLIEDAVAYGRVMSEPRKPLNIQDVIREEIRDTSLRLEKDLYWLDEDGSELP